jgi:hypothetical protein
MRCAPAGYGHPPAAAWASTSPTRTPARCGPPSPAPSWSGWSAGAARSTAAPPTAGARCWTGHRRSTATHRPPAQHRYVQARDRTCRHPGCRRPARWTDADHVHAHAEGGATDCTNLCSLCRRHHRLKTHAPGWRFTMTDDGVLSVITPSGVTRTTRPPGLRLSAGSVLVPVGGASPDHDDDLPPF